MMKVVDDSHLDPGSLCLHLLRIGKPLLPLGLHLALQAVEHHNHHHEHKDDYPNNQSSSSCYLLITLSFSAAAR